MRKMSKRGEIAKRALAAKKKISSFKRAPEFGEIAIWKEPLLFLWASDRANGLHTAGADARASFSNSLATSDGSAEKSFFAPTLPACSFWAARRAIQGLAQLIGSGEPGSQNEGAPDAADAGEKWVQRKMKECSELLEVFSAIRQWDASDMKHVGSHLVPKVRSSLSLAFAQM